MSRPTRIFGVTTDLSGTIGTGIIANSIGTNHTVDVAEARDEKGKLLDLAPYSQNEELTIDGLFVGTGVGVGTSVTIGGKDYLVSQSNKNESNTEFQTASVTCRGGDTDTVIHTLAEIQGDTTTTP